MTPKVLPTSRRSRAAPANGESVTLQSFFGVFRYSRRAMELVWSTNRGLTVALAALTLVAGVLPASVAYVGSLIVDAVVAAMTQAANPAHVVELVALEGALIATIAAAPSAAVSGAALTPAAQMTL